MVYGVAVKELGEFSQGLAWTRVADLGLRVYLECTLLVHGWDRITNLYFYSLLALSTHKNVKCYPTMTKTIACRAWGLGCKKLGLAFRADLRGSGFEVSGSHPKPRSRFGAS